MENIEMKIDSLGSIFDRFYFGKIDGLHTGKVCRLVGLGVISCNIGCRLRKTGVKFDHFA